MQIRLIEKLIYFQFKQQYVVDVMEEIMKTVIKNTWDVVMEHQHNPLKHIGDIQVRHMVLQILAWMWCVIFAMSTGSITVFGLSAVAHSLIIAGVVGTVATFEVARTQPIRIVSLWRGVRKSDS